jgi:protein-S-isoprenylcysteine O-methyltransferase Ste14
MEYIYFAKYRRFISRLMSVALIGIILFTRTTIENELMKIVLDKAGLLLITIGALGRIWTYMYIAGYKITTLVQEGPYSTVRNPLFFFSFLGTVGIALATENIIFMALIIMLFLIYYPFVILYEEAELRNIHKENFFKYAQNTPRFIPRFSKLTQPIKYEVNAKVFNRIFVSVIWFFIAYIFINFIKFMHSKGLIPLLLDI